ncbi:N-acetylmuramidase domain-containing protein [Myroides sp. JBRI-B21084]|uniref:N-acetylmuramidase domain-containing protein n=1 Tax=Myroides sp. JBRI-B21084 TaxID=3119977 RepID=UPI0026E4365F|nr:N-acetylmuramidase domain-containing protein [Paenimyroides cloacae]WKW47253.1 N-acetylmuramidase domain-containing protein [Paenimyroides cloacae]
MNQQLINTIKEHSKVNRVPFEVMMAIIEVETPGYGFDKNTGKLLIQFEPSWYRKLEPYAPSGAWSVNKVDVQSKEWIAFNSAFAIDAESAMKATSIGLPQIMGFHYKRLGYKTVGDMWNDFKKGEHQQVMALFRFILTDKNLLQSVRTKNFHMIAYIYNGAKYKEMAKKWKREPYNISLEKSAKKWEFKKM